jgi:hypothetical protein
VYTYFGWLQSVDILYTDIRRCIIVPRTVSHYRAIYVPHFVLRLCNIQELFALLIFLINILEMKYHWYVINDLYVLQKSTMIMQVALYLLCMYHNTCQLPVTFPTFLLDDLILFSDYTA